MELWEHITEFTDQNASRTLPNQWTFKYLEVIGKHLELPKHINDVCERIPKLKIETRTRYVKPKGQSKIAINFKYKPPARRPKSPPKVLKEKVVTVKVVAPKKREKSLERNCICTCQEKAKVSGNKIQETFREGNDVISEDDDGDICFEKLLEILESYDKGVRNEASSAIRRLARKFTGGKIISKDEAVEVLKMLDTNNSSVQEGVLILLNQLSSGSINAKTLLEHGIVDDLIYLMLLGATDEVQIEAAKCIAQLTEREEHAPLWIETMIISGTEALFGVLTATQETVSDGLRNAVLDAVNNLAKQAKMAPVLLDYGLMCVVDLVSSKNEHVRKRVIYPEAQRLAIKILTSVISHDVTILEQFLAKHEKEVMPGVLSLLQYGSCLQQQEAARFLATLTLFKPGIEPVVSHHTSRHLLWAMTCSHCRFVRDHASRALKNITCNADKTAVLDALSDFSMSQVQQEVDAITAHALVKQTAVMVAGSSGNSLMTSQALDDFLNNLSSSKLEKAMAEITSVLAITFQTDSLVLSGADREFIKSETKGNLLPFGKKLAKKSNVPSAKYLNSLRVLTNTIVAMGNLIRLKDRDENGKETACIAGSGANLSLAALLIQYGGLRFISQLQFLTSKLHKINPPPFYEIDPTTLPPKDLVSTLQNARTKLMFDSNKATKQQRRQYPNFGHHSTELHFVREAVNFLLTLAKATTKDFDPSLEDMKIFETSVDPKASLKKKNISFKTSANMVRTVVRFSRMPNGAKEEKQPGRGGRVIKRQSSVRSMSGHNPDTSPRSAPSLRRTSLSNASSTVGEPGTGSEDETVHYVKQSILDAKVISHLAPWVTCGVYDIQTSVIKVIRYLMHTIQTQKRASNHASSTHPKEAWGQRKPPAPQMRSSTLSQRSTTVTAGASKTKAAHLSHVCVRHVVQHCGAYLLDLLGPPAAAGLGRASLMVIREAVINGEDESRLNLVKLGCFARIIDYIRGNEDEAEQQALGLVVVRSLVAGDQSLKQLFFAHGGMSLVMALHEYKDGLVKDEAANILMASAKVTSPSQMAAARSKRTAGRSKKRSRTHTGEHDVWDQVAEKWVGQDKVAKVLKKFNVRY